MAPWSMASQDGAGGTSRGVWGTRRANAVCRGIGVVNGVCGMGIGGMVSPSPRPGGIFRLPTHPQAASPIPFTPIPILLPRVLALVNASKMAPEAALVGLGEMGDPRRGQRE